MCTGRESNAMLCHRLERLFSLSGAAALAPAGIPALTSLIARLAAALASTGVLSLAGVSAIGHGLERNPRWSWFAGCEAADGHRPGHETGDSIDEDLAGQVEGISEFRQTPWQAKAATEKARIRREQKAATMRKLRAEGPV
jgi:hypothetical protein